MLLAALIVLVLIGTSALAIYAEPPRPPPPAMQTSFF
jgi:hypothetical protein